MLIGFVEGLGAAKTSATKNHYEIEANRELIGLGTANLAAGLSSGMVVNGSLSKTAINGSAGARSQLSGLVVATLTIVTLLYLTELFEDLPEARPLRLPNTSSRQGRFRREFAEDSREENGLAAPTATRLGNRAGGL